jgi:hypothetical protein
VTPIRFTTFARLEPVASDPGLRPGLVAEIADPAWFLARQWQLGELRGDDASSPALVEFSAEIARPTRVRLGATGAARAYDPAVQPLDVLGEREQGALAVPAVVAVEASLLLAEELVAAGGTTAAVAALRAAFPAPELTVEEEAGLGDVSRDLLAATADVAFDGVAAARAAAGSVPPAARGAAFDAAIAVVRAWLDSRLPPDSAWVAEELGARVGVGVPAAGGGVAYEATRVVGERLGWWSFDRVTGALGAGATVATHSDTMPAVSLGISGAPALRYWELEDAAVDLGAVGVAPSELARLVVLEYLLVYANDMVVVPVELPYGARCVVTALTVVDTFGNRTAVAPAAAASGGKFRMWEVTGDPGALFVPPVSPSGLHGDPIEDVMVARDEQSNVAWLIELTGTDPGGGPVDLRSLAPAPATPATTAPPPAGTPLPPWRWRMANDGPLGWHPLLPEVGTDGRTRLVPGTVLGASAAPARSRLLADLRGIGVPIHLVPTEGLRLRRRLEYARWIDGSRHVWPARDRRTGQGDAGSGILFDVIERAPS